MTPVLPPSSTSSTHTSSATLSFGQLAIKDVLGDQRSASGTIARILKLAYDRDEQSELNLIIQALFEQSGTFVVNDQVKDMLLENGIQLTQRRNGTVLMREHPVLTCYMDSLRHDRIEDGLKGRLPDELADLVNSYDGEQIEFSPRNSLAIERAFTSNDPALKSQIMRSAAETGKELFLNDILQTVKNKNKDKGQFNCLDISDIDLSGLNLDQFDLTRSNLANVNLAFASVTRKDFTSTFIFSMSNLTGACALNANLPNVGFPNAILNKANFTGAVLSQCTFGFSELISANLTGADLTGAKLGRTQLVNANFSGAKLINAMLFAANLTGANLTGANLSGANLSGATLRLANLTQANLTGANLSGTDLRGANLTGADFTAADLTNADLTCAVLTGAIFTNARLTDAELPG